MTMDSDSAMEASEVADYLKENPGFFEQYADLLAEIFVPHPHGGRAIPIAERQIVTLREKNTQLETKLQELIQFGTENDAISEKLHRSTLALFAAVQTFPLTYQSPLARVSVRINEKVRWNVGWQFYNYHQQFNVFGYYQNFRAQNGYTSLSWSF